MKSANDIRDELKELNSMLADMSRAMPYQVPAGYFEALDRQLTDHSKWADSPEPATNWPKDMPYEVPAGYFETLPGIVSGIVSEPLLSLNKAMPQAVPEGYFEALPQQLLQKVKTAEKAQGKTIALTGGNIWKTVRWAAAAVVILGIGLGIYSNYDTMPAVYNPQLALAQVPQDSIKAYVQQHIDEFDTELLAGNLEAADVNALTNKLTEEEIKNYLDETGWDESTMNL